MDLKEHISIRKKQKKILIMAHQILGYPNFETNLEMIKLFQKYDIDLLELQLPFSEPIADGPVFLKANQEALKNGTKIKDCLDFAEKITENFNIPIVFMTYYNILFQYGVENFVKKCKDINVKGLIIPDALPSEHDELYQHCNKYNIDTILLTTPFSSYERLEYISKYCKGFMYCAARKGVTGYKTEFNEEISQFLNTCKQVTELPIGVGFGIQKKEDIDFLKNKADVAIIGSELLKILENNGLEGVEEFLNSLLT
ncbi:tryptophan synthase subunit alpha [Bacillus alkalicellulosilyticus]|uniref:tryptophan synthase subunit alpha n=1 Tax=Alkalihalobacterium alkalicellulosilyticum TaxID=1912214 RepID=UPI000996AAE9|nr:tryptophan synthase subunit alpha [Bacillus alkalicellulosilyticus]